MRNARLDELQAGIKVGRGNINREVRGHFGDHCPHEPEKVMAPHSSALVWRIPGMAEPGGLLSMGSHRVGHN